MNSINTLQELRKLNEQIEELVSNLQGMTIEYEGKYAVINDVDEKGESILLYIERADQTSYFQEVSFNEYIVNK